MLPAPSTSARVTVPPEKMTAVAWFTVSISDPAAPVAVEVADPEVPGSLPVTARSAVSPAAPFTHSFRKISVAEVRLLVKVQVTAAGAAGTTKLPPCPSASGVRPGWSQVIGEV